MVGTKRIERLAGVGFPRERAQLAAPEARYFLLLAVARTAQWLPGRFAVGRSS